METAYGQDVEFVVLGPVGLIEGGQRVPLGGPKQRTVLAMVVANAGHTVSFDRIVEATWGNEPPEGARASIHTYISNLRSVVGDVVERLGDGYVLLIDEEAIDAVRFEELYRRASEILGEEPERAAGMLREALGLWTGHPYADVDARGALDPEITRLEELRVAALQARIDADLALGHHRALIGELEALSNEYPLQEGFRVRQMLALYRSGRQAEALRLYDRTRRYLGEELGIEPSSELQRLQQRILDHDPALDLEMPGVIRRVAMLVADVGDEEILPRLEPSRRADLIDGSQAAFELSVAEAGGTVFAWRGAAIYASFERVIDAIGAVSRTFAALGAWEVLPRFSIDAGDVEFAVEGFTGPTVSRAAALVAAAHSGQVLLSSDAHAELATSNSEGWQVRALGSHRLWGFDRARPVYQLLIEGHERQFPSLRLDAMPPPLPEAGRGLFGYELRDLIGVGSLGEVYRAYQPSVGREVAIKVLKDRFVNEPEFIRRFEVEAQAVARLEHPHVVPLYDYWREPDRAYLVMRWLRGKSLADRLADGPLGEEEVSRIVGQVGGALHTAHRRGLLHRDLKPTNVMLDEEGNSYLTDFGIAATLTGPDDRGPTETGSWEYISPEERAGQPVTEASDLFALGVLTHHLMIGHPPGVSLDIGSYGLPAELETVLKTATEPDPKQRYADVGQFVAAFEIALGAPSAPHFTYTRSRNPYKGLSAFSQSDAADFHGRDDVTEEILRQIASSRLTAVVGPSGVGKSSVVRAGVVPRLRFDAVPGSSKWFITEMVPGRYPFEEFATALLRVAAVAVVDLDDDLRRDRRGMLRSIKRCLPPDAELLIVIDQFEELFTLTDSETREAVLDALTTLVSDDRSPARVVLTIRADYFDEPLRHAELGIMLQGATVPVGAPTIDQLHQMVEEPAAALGVGYEPGLTSRIIDQVEGESGALPLLEFALTELFDARQSDMITNAEFETTGGVVGALGARADTTFEALGSQGEEAARQLFMRLVSVDDTGRPTRRRAHRAELMRLPVSRHRLETALNAFGSARLLTFDRDSTTRGPTVEVAHEAILQEWPRLRSWIEDQKESLILGRRLRTALEEWESNQRHDDYLLTGQRLASFATLEESFSLSREELDYYRASVEQDRAIYLARRRRRRTLVGVLGLAAVVATILGTIALAQANRAESEARTATTRRLAGDSTIALTDDPELAILLALESAYLTRDAGEQLLPETISALHEATQTSRLELRLENAFGPVAVSPDGSTLATISIDEEGSGTVAAIWDAVSGESLLNLSGEVGGATDIVFSPDGSLLAVTYFHDISFESYVGLYDTATWTEMGRIGDGALRVAWSPDDTRLATVTTPDRGRPHETLVTLWDVDTGGKRFSVPGGSIDPGFNDIVFADDETLLVPDRATRRVVLYDAATGEQVNSIEVGSGDTNALPSGLSVDRNRGLLMVGFFGADFVELWDLKSRSLSWSVDVPASPNVAISPGGGLLASGGIDGLVRLHDPDDGSVVTALAGHTGDLGDIAFYPDGERLVSAGFEGEARVWKITPSGDGGVLDTGPVSDVLDIHLSPNGEEITVNVTGATRRFEVATGELLGSIEGTMNQFVAAPVSPDWRLHAYVDSVGEGWVRDLVDGGIVAALPPCTVPRAFSQDGSTLVLDGASLCRGDPPQGFELRSRLIDVATGEELLDFDAFPVGAGSPGAVFNPAGVFDQDRFLAVNIQGQLGIYDLSGEEPVLIWDPDTVEGFGVRTLAFDPSGRYLSAVGNEGRAFVLDMIQLIAGDPLSETVVFDQIVDTGVLIGVALNADGVLATSAFGSLRLWDIHTGEHLVDIPVEGAIPPHARFSPDGNHLYYVDDPGLDVAILRRFPLDTEVLIALAEDRVTRGFTMDECHRFLDTTNC